MLSMKIIDKDPEIKFLELVFYIKISVGLQITIIS